MKKIIGIAVLFSFFGALTAYGAIQIKAIKPFDFVAQIESMNKGNFFVYEVERPDAKCFVLIGDDSKYGFEPQMSCVGVTANSVVKK